MENFASALTNKLFSLALLCLTSTWIATGFSASRIDKKAQALAKQLAPAPPARKFNEKELATLGKRMTASLEILEKSYRTSGPAPESLISKALTFRKDMADYEKMLITNALISNWREANARGLFDKDGKYTSEISKGRGVGDRMKYELIIPGEVFAPASNQLANVRLVLSTVRRSGPEPLGAREKATLEQLEQMIAEKTNLAGQTSWENHKMNRFGRSADEEIYLWEKAMEEAGAAAQKLPSIRINAKSEATPTHATKYRWRAKCEILNHSSHPTEVKVEFWQIGYTWKKRDHYVMSKMEKTLKLRQNQSIEFDVFSKPEKSYKKPADDYDGLSKEERKKSRVRYRGFAVRVTHEKGLVSFSGNDKYSTAYVDPSVEDRSIERLPQF